MRPESLEQKGLSRVGEKGSTMARHFGATQLDQQVAKAVVRNASPALEWPARLLIWAADEHVLNLVAGGVAVSANGRRSGTASTAQASEAQALSHLRHHGGRSRHSGSDRHRVP